MTPFSGCAEPVSLLVNYINLGWLAHELTFSWVWKDCPEVSGVNHDDVNGW